MSGSLAPMYSINLKVSEFFNLLHGGLIFCAGQSWWSPPLQAQYLGDPPGA